MVDKKITLQGTKKELMQLIPQMTAIYQLIEGLDVEGGGYDSEMHPSRRYHPLIKLYFRQDSDFIPGIKTDDYKGRNRKRGILSFRLMNETAETISEAELTNIARRIKDIFGEDGGYIWNKGKELYCYADWSKGYQLQILAKSRTQAADLVTKILSIQNHTPQWIYFTKTNNDAELERYPETPQTKVILGETVTLAKVRPLIDVRFQYAEATIHKLAPRVVLYDRRGKKAKPLVK